MTLGSLLSALTLQLLSALESEQIPNTKTAAGYVMCCDINLKSPGYLPPRTDLLSAAFCGSRKENADC